MADVGNTRAASPTLARIIPLPLPPRPGAGRERPVAGRHTPPDSAVRWSRVRSARARMTTGYYDLPGVRDSIADAVLGELQGA